MLCRGLEAPDLTAAGRLHGRCFRRIRMKFIGPRIGPGNKKQKIFKRKGEGTSRADSDRCRTSLYEGEIYIKPVIKLSVRFSSCITLR